MRTPLMLVSIGMVFASLCGCSSTSNEPTDAASTTVNVKGPPPGPNKHVMKPTTTSAAVSEGNAAPTTGGGTTG